MDRRQRKSREAIFRAFTQLLTEKSLSHITVGEIIDRADVGRATFYAHFETKDYLLKALCEDLFCHLFDAMEDRHEHRHIFECEVTGSAVEHLCYHLQNNDHQLLQLLTGQNREVFLPYFHAGISNLVSKQLHAFEKPAHLPEDLWLDHISGTLIRILLWWIDHGWKQTPKEISDWFGETVNIG